LCTNCAKKYSIGYLFDFFVYIAQMLYSKGFCGTLL
jgi:hypothetical protein